MAYGYNDNMSDFWESDDYQASSLDDFLQSGGSPGSEGALGPQIQSAMFGDLRKAEEAERKRQESQDKAIKLLLDSGYQGSLDAIKEKFASANLIADETMAGRMDALTEGADRQRSALDDLEGALGQFSMERPASDLEARAEEGIFGADASRIQIEAKAEESRDAMLKRIRESEASSDKDYEASRQAAKRAEQQAIKTKEEFDSRSFENEIALNDAFRQETEENIRAIKSDPSLTPQQKTDMINQVQEKSRQQIGSSVGRLVSQRFEQSAALGNFVAQTQNAVSQTHAAIGNAITQRTLANTSAMKSVYDSYNQAIQFGAGLVEGARQTGAQLFGTAAQMRAQAEAARMEGQKFLAQAKVQLENSVSNGVQALWKDYGAEKTRAVENQAQQFFAAQKNLFGASAILEKRQYGVVQTAAMFSNFFKTAALAGQAGGVDFGREGGAFNYQELASSSPWDSSSFLNFAPNVYSGPQNQQNQDTFPFPQYG